MATIHCCECGLFKSTEEGTVDLWVECSTHITSTIDGGFLLISEQLFGSPVVDKEKKYTCMRIYILKVVIHNNLMVQALQMLSLENAAQETVIESLLCIAASSRHARGLLLIISEKKNQSVYGW